MLALDPNIPLIANGAAKLASTSGMSMMDFTRMSQLKDFYSQDAAFETAG
jgi:hypothetical protein